MYYITQSQSVPGSKQLIQMGYPTNVTPDICLCTSINSYAHICLNAAMLREALLASPQILEQVLCIRVADLLAPPPQVILGEDTPKPKIAEPSKTTDKRKKAIAEASAEEDVEWN